MTYQQVFFVIGVVINGISVEGTFIIFCDVFLDVSLGILFDWFLDGLLDIFSKILWFRLFCNHRLVWIYAKIRID